MWFNICLVLLWNIKNISNYMYIKWSLGIMKLNNIYLLLSSIFVNIIINKMIDNIKLIIMNI